MMTQEAKKEEALSAGNGHDALFISIRSEADAVVSRSRAAIAGSLLCILFLIVAIQFFLQGSSIDPGKSPDAAAERLNLYVSACVNLFLIVVVTVSVIFIAIKNSRIAAMALLTLAAVDAVIYGLNVFSSFAAAPTTIFGLLLGGVARFFVVVTAINALQGVLALQKYKQVNQLPIQ